MYEGFFYETLPDFIASKNLSPDLKEQIPLYTDGLPLWDAYLKFFENYVDFFYTGCGLSFHFRCEFVANWFM